MDTSKTDFNRQVAVFFKENGTLAALIILAVLFGFLDDSFFTPRNLTNLVRQATIIGIISVGMTLVIIIAGIDLSVGSVVGLSAIMVTLLMQHDMGVWIAILLTLLVSGIAVGLWNGFWIAHYNIPPFIITLGMYTIARGLALTLSKGSSVPVTDPVFPKLGGAFIPSSISGIFIIGLALLFFFNLFISIRQKRKYNGTISVSQLATTSVIAVAGLGFAFWVFTTYRGIPCLAAILFVIAAAGIFILNNTKLGRRIYAIGGNEEAARLSGIRIYRN